MINQNLNKIFIIIVKLILILSLIISAQKFYILFNKFYIVEYNSIINNYGIWSQKFNDFTVKYPFFGEIPTINLYKNHGNSNMKYYLGIAEKYNKYNKKLIKFQVQYYAINRNTDLLGVYRDIYIDSLYNSGIFLSFDSRKYEVCVGESTLIQVHNKRNCILELPSKLFNELLIVHNPSYNLELPANVIADLVKSSVILNNIDDEGAYKRALHDFFDKLNDYSKPISY